jgi:hypothetical protein
VVENHRKHIFAQYVVGDHFLCANDIPPQYMWIDTRVTDYLVCFRHSSSKNNGGLDMPGVDSQIFSLALSVFLVFGATNLAIELTISLVVLCKRLKATVQSHYSLESGRLDVPSPSQSDEFPKISASLLTQIMALSPADRQIIRSVLDISSANGSLIGDQEKRVGGDSTSDGDQDLGWLRISGGKSNSDLTH